MDKGDMKVLASRIRLLRIIEGKTQEELAHMLNVSRSCLANYETGRRMPDDATIQSVAKHFGVKEAYLRGLVPSDTVSFLTEADSELTELMPPNGLLDLSNVSVEGKIALLEFYKFLKERAIQKQKQAEK